MSKKLNDINKRAVLKNSKHPKIIHPVFCFKYLTKNKKYNFNYFGKEKDRLKAYQSLYNKLVEVSEYTWLEFYRLSKDIGLETIKYSNFKFSINNFILSKDDKLIIIRFNNQKYRIIGIKSQHTDCVFHILGFDFDYSAYNHS